MKKHYVYAYMDSRKKYNNDLVLKIKRFPVERTKIIRRIPYVIRTPV